MRASFLILVCLVLVCLALGPATAGESLRLPPTDAAPASKTLPLKGAAGAAKANSCAAYGSGFVMVEATGTCVKVSGAIRVDGAVRR
jgi:hypothetical protein